MFGHGCEPDFDWVPDFGSDGGVVVDGVVVVGVVVVGVVVVWVVDGVALVLVDDVVVGVAAFDVAPSLEPVEAEAPAIPAAAPPLASAPATIVAPSILEIFISIVSPGSFTCVAPESDLGFGCTESVQATPKDGPTRRWESA
ncbi:MAG TPA: hypothetical protein VMB51_03110 [Solirubrobacteraceae bacterium]|nr:hypothetical protein [Solirubrobacteraceae bacterium]